MKAIEDGDGPSVAQAMMGNPETAVFLSSVPLDPGQVLPSDATAWLADREG